MLSLNVSTVRAELSPAQRISARASRLNSASREALEKYIQTLDEEWLADTANYIERKPMEFHPWQQISDALFIALQEDACQMNRLLASQNID